MWNIEKRYLECTCDRNNRQILLFTTNAEQIMALTFMDEGRIEETADKETFFTNPKSDRTKLFLSKILSH